MAKENKFTAEDICNIIKSSINTNITYLKINDLEIAFNGYLENQEEQNQVIYTPTTHTEIPEEKPPYYDADLEALQMENLMIEDPLEYEKQMGEQNG